MNILVTGSRGALGTALCKRLREEGHRVIGWDLSHSCQPGEYRVDIRTMRNGDLPHLNAVIHLAAEFGRANGDDYHEELWTTGCVGTNHAIWLAKLHNAKLIFASSSEVYGDFADSGVALSETNPLNLCPRFHNEYALSKFTNEQQIHISGVPHVIMRIFNVYGPGEPPHQYRSVVARFMRHKIEDTTATVYDGGRTHLYIDDFVEAALLLMNQQGTFNVGCDEPPLHNEELAKAIGCKYELVGKESNNVYTKRPDPTKLRSLGWEPRVSLTEGLQRTEAWMRKFLS